MQSNVLSPEYSDAVGDWLFRPDDLTWVRTAWEGWIASREKISRLV
jgi:hypothetical protein